MLSQVKKWFRVRKGFTAICHFLNVFASAESTFPLWKNLLRHFSMFLVLRTFSVVTFASLVTPRLLIAACLLSFVVDMVLPPVEALVLVLKGL
jgi:hypothetical protein